MDPSSPNWAATNTEETKSVHEEIDPVLDDRQPAANSSMEISDGASPQLAPSAQRKPAHSLYRLFKFVTIAWSLLLFIAQLVSVVYLPFDGIELMLKIFLSSFSVLIILNELEWWPALRDSPLFKNFITRGYFYVFLGLVSTEENNIKPSKGSVVSNLPVDYTAALFIETASWAMVAIGILYFLSGLCCGQYYINKVREDHSNRLAERKRIFEVGMKSEAALSNQMIT